MFRLCQRSPRRPRERGSAHPRPVQPPYEHAHRRGHERAHCWRRADLIDDAGIVVAFYIIGITTVLSALMVVVVRNLVHAVLFLVLTFVGIAGIYIVLSAD